MRSAAIACASSGWPASDGREHWIDPFTLGNESGYRAWREVKLERARQRSGALEIVDLANPGELTDHEGTALLSQIADRNFCLYRVSDPDGFDKEDLSRLCTQLGLMRRDTNICADEDGVTELTVVETGEGSRYLPYTRSPLNWHTDGYYNPSQRAVRSFVLHCKRAAAQGGENALLDPELVYIALRDEQPELIAALMAPDALTIPPNHSANRELRPSESGPVFSVDPVSGHLSMRYTARTRSVVWRDDPVTQRAAQRIREITGGKCRHIVHHRLEPGQGVISNNVLHRRAGFSDSGEVDEARLLYRARYYDRVAGQSIMLRELR